MQNHLVFEHKFLVTMPKTC